jgi:transposase-like protein
LHAEIDRLGLPITNILMRAQELRPVALRRILAGEPQTDVAKSLGLHRNTLSKWLRLYQEEQEALKVEARKAEARAQEAGGSAGSDQEGSAPQEGKSGRPRLVAPRSGGLYLETGPPPTPDPAREAEALKVQGLALLVAEQVNEQLQALFVEGRTLTGQVDRRAANRRAADAMATCAPIAALILKCRLADLYAGYRAGKINADEIKEMMDLSHKILTRALGQPKLPLEAMHADPNTPSTLDHLSDDELLELLTRAQGTRAAVATLSIQGTRAAEPSKPQGPAPHGGPVAHGGPVLDVEP